MNRDVAVVGAGMTKFGDRFDMGYYDLIGEAFSRAKQHVDKGISNRDIEAGWLGTGYGTLSIDDEIVSGGKLSHATGLQGIPMSRVENACGTGADAVRNAIHGIESGRYDIVAVVGAEKMRDKPTEKFLRIAAEDNPRTLGMTAPAFFGMYAQRHMHEYGTTREQMAEVAVKNHENGTNCEYSHFDFSLTVDDVLDAPSVAYPLGLYDCSPQTDGGACLVLASDKVARQYTDSPVWVRGLGNSATSYHVINRDGYTEALPTVEAAQMAYDEAGIQPGDVDVAEQHDCFTFTEIMNMEDLGFCEKGKGGEFVASGQTRLDGEVAVNPSGGLKAKGHPIGATGVAQICELTWQLRNEATNRQVDDANIGLQHNIGGPLTVSNVTVVANER